LQISVRRYYIWRLFLGGTTRVKSANQISRLGGKKRLFASSDWRQRGNAGSDRVFTLGLIGKLTRLASVGLEEADRSSNANAPTAQSVLGCAMPGESRKARQ
jgi:hypothetical protein